MRSEVEKKEYCVPDEFSAQNRFPEIFTKKPDEQDQIFKNFSAHIQKFHGFQQWKQSRKEGVGEDIKHILPDSLFFLKAGEEYRYFLVPNKHMNLLGAGSYGQVIPAYELKPHDKIWRLNPEDEPTIAIKIRQCSDDSAQLNPLQEKIKTQMKIMGAYYERSFPFTEPFTRSVTKHCGLFENTKSFYKIYIPMPYCPGKNGVQFLEAWKTMKLDGALSEEEKAKKNLDFLVSAIRYSISFMESVIKLHRMGIFHGDLKNENLKIHKEDVLLVDFDFSRSHSDSGKDGGTLLLVPPEFLTGECIWTEAGETYTAGLTIYELLGGKDLFSSCQTIHEIKKRNRQNISRVDECFLDCFNSQVDPKLLSVLKGQIKALLCLNPAARPPLPQVIDAFKQVLQEIECPPLKKLALSGDIPVSKEPEAPETPPPYPTPSPSPGPK
jgi:serine/threonine protein kinase